MAITRRLLHYLQSLQPGDPVCLHALGSWQEGTISNVSDEDVALIQEDRLLYLPFEEGAQVPKFCHSVKKAAVPKDGWRLYYTNQCPHTAKYVPVLVDAAAERGIKIQPVHIKSREAAQNAPNPFTTYALYRDGEFLTNEILSEKSFDKLLTRMNETGK